MYIFNMGPDGSIYKLVILTLFLLENRKMALAIPYAQSLQYDIVHVFLQSIKVSVYTVL